MSTTPAPADGLRLMRIAPFVGALLLYVCYFPLSFSPVAWVALIPWLCLVRLPYRPGLYRWFFLGAFAFHVAAMWWFTAAHWLMSVALVTLALICTAYTLAAFAVLRRLDGVAPLVLTAPAVWVTFDYLRGGVAGVFVGTLTGAHGNAFPGGFGWYFLGHTQHDFAALIQIADATGAHGVTFLVVMANALIFEALYRRDGWRLARYPADAPQGLTRGRLLRYGVLTAILLLGSLAYGVFRLRHETTEGPLVALLQGNHPQIVRNDTTNPDKKVAELAFEETGRTYRGLVSNALARRPALVVWPETSYPAAWIEEAPGVPHEKMLPIRTDIARLQTPMLLGMMSFERGDDRVNRQFNSAVYLGADGARLGRYDKAHLVPFGEYIPFAAYLPFLRRLSPYDYDFEVAPGRGFPRMTLPDGTTFGVLICYEDTVPSIAREYSRRDPPDFLLNISNDGWFDGSAEHEQHLAICRFRAVETRRAIGRAVNMGISGLIDSSGRVVRPVATVSDDFLVWEANPSNGPLSLWDWPRFKKVPGVVLARVPLDGRTAPYAYLGDAFALCCVAGVGVFLILARRRPAA